VRVHFSAHYEARSIISGPQFSAHRSPIFRCQIKRGDWGEELPDTTGGSGKRENIDPTTSSSWSWLARLPLQRERPSRPSRQHAQKNRRSKQGISRRLPWRLGTRASPLDLPKLKKIDLPKLKKNRLRLTSSARFTAARASYLCSAAHARPVLYSIHLARETFAS
jgi:hypothetical protein